MARLQVVAWLKAVGDKVEMGEAVLVVESDKADMDVESYDEGYLAAIVTGKKDPIILYYQMRNTPPSPPPKKANK